MSASTVAKRGIDVIGAVVGLGLTGPLLAAVAVVVRWSSGSPVLYRARRVGLHGVEFDMVKFRTMRPELDGPRITGREDARITPVGAVLRRTKIDELPQLVNVLRGEMSLVGPRPEDPRYVAMYTAAQREVLAIRPGITSAASLRFRDECDLLGSGPGAELRYVNLIMPAKLQIDLAYARRHRLRDDIAIMAGTVLALLRRRPRRPREGPSGGRP